MPKLVALCRCPFGVGEKQKGEVFEASEHEANILIALQRAALVPEEKPAEPVQKAPEPAANADTSETDTVREKRAYRRRDLTAGE